MKRGMVFALLITLRAFGATVENSVVKFTFREKPVPALDSIVHKASGMELLASGGQPLFVARITTSEGKGVDVLSGQARRGTCVVSTDKQTAVIDLVFDDFPSAAGLSIHLRGALAPNEPFARWSVMLSNPKAWAIATVKFPYIDAVPTLGDAEDDVIIGPALPGVLIENPATNWPARYTASWRFPGEQSVQFCAYQDRTAGLYVASMDTEGYRRALAVSKRDKALHLEQEYTLPEQPVTQWHGPYQTALGVTSGTWYQTADIYKKWALAQAWCAKPLTQRADIPGYWKAGVCIHTCEVRTYDSARLCNGSYYAQLNDHLRTLRTRINGPVMPMLPGWENHRRWTAGDYFPIFDEGQAVGVLKHLRQEDFRPFFYFSGLYYTFENEGRDAGAFSNGLQYAQAFVLSANKENALKQYVLDESHSGTNGIWKRHSYQFCPAAPATRPFFCSVIDRLHALGVDVVQMDQTTSGAGDACFSAEHGHVPGPGVYQSQSFRALLAALRQHGKALTPDFMLAHEETHEELIPYVDAFHTREYREKWWYHGAPGGRSIPLFSYLYHEFAIAYGGEGPGISARKNPATVRELAVNLVTGKTPAAAIWSSHQSMTEIDADQIRMLRNHMTLLKTEVRDFLILGRMLHPLEITVPSITFTIPAKRATGWKNEPFVEPAVLTSAWQAPDGKIGYVFVNISAEQQHIVIHLDARAMTMGTPVNIDAYCGESTTPQQVYRKIVLPQAHTLRLNPLDAVVLVVKPANEQ